MFEELARPFALALAVVGAIMVVSMILYWQRKKQELAAAAERDIPGPLQAERSGGGSGGVTQPPLGLRHTIRGLEKRLGIRLLTRTTRRVARVMSGAIPSFSPVPIGLLTPLVLKLAARNLLYDKLRFVATVIGIVFSIVLVTIQLGLFVSFESMVTIMIDHAPADLWIVPLGTKCFEDLSLLDEANRYQGLSIEGVSQVDPILVSFAQWRMPDGGTSPVLVIGSDLRRRTASMESGRRQPRCSLGSRIGCG